MISFTNVARLRIHNNQLNIMAGIPPAVVIPQPLPEIDQISQILEWIGFTDQGQRTRIINDAFTTYDDILAMNDKDVTELSTLFGRRTAANEKIDFGIRRTKKAHAFIALGTRS